MGKRKRHLHYDFSNLSNTDVFENMDTSVADLTKQMVRVIQSGDVDRAMEYTSSDMYQAFLAELLSTPEFVVTSYIYNCVAAYISAIEVLSSYSAAEHLLYTSTKAKYDTPAEWIGQMPQTIIDFTRLVAQDRLPKGLSSIVTKACSYIGDHLFSPYDPEALTAYCKCSRSYLSHRFKEEMGMTIIQYIHGLKVEKACTLLESSDMSVARISAKLGFCSESYFISVFRKVKGTTPGRYRNRFAGRTKPAGNV